MHGNQIPAFYSHKIQHLPLLISSLFLSLFASKTLTQNLTKEKKLDTGSNAQLVKRDND